MWDFTWTHRGGESAVIKGFFCEKFIKQMKNRGVSDRYNRDYQSWGQQQHHSKALANSLKGTGCDSRCGLTDNPRMSVYRFVKRNIAAPMAFERSRKLQSGPTPPTHPPLTHTHTRSKGERECVASAFGLSLGCGPRGNGCFPSPATALWLNWPGLLDLSVCEGVRPNKAPVKTSSDW